MKNYKIAVAGTGYVGLSLGVLLSQHHQVVAVDIVQAKVDMINNKKSPIQDDYIEKYLAEKDLNLTATLDAKAAWMFFKYFVKAWVAIYLVSNTFTITMAVFDVGQSVVNSASGIINGETAIDVSSLSMQMQAAMATMEILNVLLKNKGFDTIARKNMDRKQTGRYDAYNLTYGNRPELFGAGSPTYSGGTTGSIGSGGSGGTGGSSGGGFRYDIPEEALSDEKFARMIAEAEKYLGMPYVWGGSSPSTSFDCSGFVCWVINNCGNGWNVGRTTANGLRGKCSYVSPADAQPGDLIFFEKTYNTVGASHVGIYVGNGMMIHCGDPISYTSINSTYWQNHFLGFGRIK